MAITLYYAPRTRATRVAFLLEELGVTWTRVSLDLSKQEHKTPAYLAIHPQGLVPALRDGDITIFETVAICLYLSDRYPEKGLAPALMSKERAAYYQWIVYSVSTLEPTIADIFIYQELPAEKQDAAYLQEKKKRFDKAAEVLERALHEREYLLGAQFSTADVLVGSMLIWAASLGLLGDHPGLATYAARIGGRSAFSRSLA